MKRIYLRQFIKTLILFLIISIVMLLVQEYDSFYARFTASTMKEAVLYESLKDFYVNACPLEFVESFGLGFWQILIPLISIY